jgi:hypothetical protein
MHGNQYSGLRSNVSLFLKKSSAMIIIAGAGHPKTEKHITTNMFHCDRCNNTSYWILEKTKYHITLFFLPVAPYKTDYLFYCSICGNGSKLDKESFENKVKFNAKPYQ